MLTEMAAVSTETDVEFVDDKKIITGDLKEGALVIMAMKNLQPIETLRDESNIFSQKLEEDGVRTVGVKKGNKTTFIPTAPHEKWLHVASHFM